MSVNVFDGTSGTAELGADDNASPIIDDVMDKASAWDGSVFTATMSIVDAATAPMGAVLNAAKNPIAQGATYMETPTIFSASDCQGIINNFLPTIHEVY